MDSLKDWRFWIGFGIIGYLVLQNADHFNSIIKTTVASGGDYTKILQGR